LSSTVFITLPAYNEESALRQLLPDIAQTLQSNNLPYKICVVDDGSIDGTNPLVRTLAQEIPLEYIRHATNQGYGASLRSGLLWVIQNGHPEDIAVTMDSDTTHSPRYIPTLLNKLAEGYDVVTASYTAPGGRSFGVPWQRRLLSQGANGLLRLRFHLPGVRTYTNGFRAYRVKALQRASQRYGERWLKENNFAGGTEAFIKVCRAGGRAGEVPFDLHYEKRGTDSKIHIPRTILSYLKLLGC
jgi:dolichol-phosphate mannosyltransferase